MAKLTQFVSETVNLSNDKLHTIRRSTNSMILIFLTNFFFSEAMDLTPLMLKKNPNCVETMKRMRRYVGNTKKWDMTDDLEKEFNIKSGLIRNRAEQIYNSFKV